nr:hypothetical protein [Nocardioides luteus]
MLCDIEALSAAGVPVYAERGRHGVYSLLPGFRTELTGLNHDEALALLTAGSGRAEQIFGLGSALASAMRKMVDALPEGHQTATSDAAQRFLLTRRPTCSRAGSTSTRSPTTPWPRSDKQCSPDTSCTSTTPPEARRRADASSTRSVWSPCARRATC